MIGKPSGYIETLPKPLRNRIAYLGELQDQHDDLEEKLHEEQVALHRKYEALWSRWQHPLHVSPASLHLLICDYNRNYPITYLEPCRQIYLATQQMCQLDIAGLLKQWAASAHASPP